MYDELKTLLHARKLTVEEGYYASMTVARLGVLLAKPIEAIEAQLHGMTCSYETLLNYLHFAHCKDVTICRMDKIEIFLRESPRQKVYYLLKTLKASTDKTTARTLFTQTYLRHLVPEHLSGFEEIADVLEDFEGEE